MNSINSIQSVNNKIVLNIFVPPTITINNSDWSTPVVASGQAVRIETILSSTTFTNLYDWNYDAVITALLYSNSGINLIMTNDYPAFVTELNTTHPQSMALCFYYAQGSVNVTQSISFTTVGTYRLTFYAAAFNGSYTPSVHTLSASIGGSSLAPFSLTTNSTYTQYTLDFTITSTGNYTLSFLTTNTDQSVNTALNLTAVSIIYLHA